MTGLQCEPAHKYHPQFDSGDVVLCSSEGTRYRIPSHILKITCGLFRNTLCTTNPALEVQEVNEKDNVLERVLRLICGLETPRWKSFDELEESLELAEKWDAPGPISVIRSAITAPIFLEEPLRLYSIATRVGWEEETKIASTHSLALDLCGEEHQAQLERLASKHLMALFKLHRRRRDKFKHSLDNDPIYNHGNCPQTPCTGCGEKLDNHRWKEFKARAFVEMDQRPLGDTLISLDIAEWPETIACWAAKCSNKGCEKPNYDPATTLRAIELSIRELPITI